ncbi:MAG: tetratricopeptide repeat protein [Gammaproteobacteria bacterium]|nr:tetratricopeptide repeat protein [Gammaproteobacteria bacterium]
MRRQRAVILLLISMCLLACATSSKRGTLAELQRVPADVNEVYLDDSLNRAAQSYRSYLEETAESTRTPEAMRRLADLQIEQEYGVIGGGGPVEMAAPATAARTDLAVAEKHAQEPKKLSESEPDFERRATGNEKLLSNATPAELPGAENGVVPAGPHEAIQTYWKILEIYPNYERNDQVHYQLARAYDEIGESNKAMSVMDQLVAAYPRSKFVDEVYFRRGEYFFVRKKYRDAEEAYGAIIDSGSTSSYYELALYKMGWTLYKQDFYEEALHRYVAMLDFRQANGYDFDQDFEEEDEIRVADTFRVISLSFSNLGEPAVVDEYFSQYGHRSYADKIYGNLGEFYFGKLRYDDAASVYKSFISLNPLHKVSPHFSMRGVEIYGEAGFSQLVVESKKEFATNYALDAEYWNHFDVNSSPEVVGFLKTNLTDLASHYHALYQDEELIDERPDNFTAAQHWYQQFLQSFPMDSESPQINYQLADLLLENEDFGEAAREYERTAYEYAAHEQNAAAGYAAIYAHRKNLDVATDTQRRETMQATVSSSLRFADTFGQHEQAPVVLGAAADILYEMEDFPRAIETAQKLVDRYPGADATLRRAAWVVVAHSSIDLAEYQNAEHAYLNVLKLTADDDETKPAIFDGLAAAIYKQGEAANLAEDYRAAADHFLRIKTAAPGSEIRSAAEYDAAAALMKLQDWTMASEVLEEFRTSHPQHKLQSEATRNLAFVYRESGQIERSAAEHERIAAEATDPELGREALLTAGELYDEVDNVGDAVRIYRRYVAEYPKPLDMAMETRSRLAEIFEAGADYEQYHAQMREIVAADRAAGGERTDRSRYLGAKAALVLAELTYEQFASLGIVQPIEQTLAQKQQRMDAAITALEALVGYEVAEVTAAATYYIAETYLNFSNALLGSDRPADLSKAEAAEYDMALEEEAFPFEERGIEVHEANFELLATGVNNPWVQNSLDKLTVLSPGRYAKGEISAGFVGSVDMYAYRMPVAPEFSLDSQNDAELIAPDEQAESPAGPTPATNAEESTN